MLDTSNNLTLQQINYEQDEEESLSAISEIKYEDDYSFLNQFSFNGDHLVLSKLRFQPNNKKMDIEFYEDLEESDLNEKLQRKDKMSDMKNHRKIGTMTFRQNNQIKQPIKLPFAKYPIIMKVQSNQKQVLHGQLSKKDGQSNISLFDKQGNKKGSFQYYIQAKHAQKVLQQELEEDDTLNSRDFNEEIALTKKQPKKKATPTYIPIRQKRLDVSKRTTMKIQTFEMEQKKHHLHSSDEQDENKSEKSEIDYLGYENPSKLEERVAEYRLPMQRKNIMEASRLIDYQSLKKNMEELGISKNHQIQSILLQRKRKYHDEPKQIEEQSKQITEDDINPTTQIVTQTAQVSFQDFSSQAEESRPQVAQCGVGTYTPLPSRLNDNIFKTSRISKGSNHSRKQSIHQNGKYEYPRNANISDMSMKEQQPALRSSHIPRTHFVRTKQAVDSSFQADSLKNEPLPKHPSHDRQLSMRNRVYEIRVGQNNSRTGSRQSKRQDWLSLKQSSSHKLNLSDSCQQQSVLYPQVDITINNLSVNFHKKSFGAKMVQLSIAPTTYRTESLSGNNLIWIGKDYLFKGVSGNSQLSVSLKQSTQQLQQTLAQVKIKVSDLIINKKKSYFQTFLLSRKEVVAILIVGFQIIKKTYSVSKQAFPLKIARQSHPQTEISRSKTTKIKRSPRKKEQRIDARQEGLPSPRANPIRMRKYKGGKNIKIGRASRFANGCINVPGPGDYHIESQFSRHALKDF